MKIHGRPIFWIRPVLAPTLVAIDCLSADQVLFTMAPNLEFAVYAFSNSTSWCCCFLNCSPLTSLEKCWVGLSLWKNSTAILTVKVVSVSWSYSFPSRSYFVPSTDHYVVFSFVATRSCCEWLDNVPSDSCYLSLPLAFLFRLVRH